MKFALWATNATRALVACAGIAVLSAAMTGCDGRRDTREILNMPDMHFSPAYKAQEENPFAEKGPMMVPPEGTIPVNFIPYTITTAEADTKAAELQNPLTPTAEVLFTGQKYYNISCTPCHGPAGDGLGSVIKANAGMPMPPKLYSEKIRNEWTDGRIFHVITRGQGNMPAYAARIDSDKRWAIIHYVRSLGDAWEAENMATDSGAAPEDGQASVPVSNPTTEVAEASSTDQ